MHPIERAVIQGYPPKICQGLNKTKVVRATGNAWPVHVLAKVLHGLSPLAKNFSYDGLAEATFNLLGQHMHPIERASNFLGH